MKTGKIMKAASRLLPMLLFATLILAFASCGNKKPTPEEVAQKLEANQTLDEADYGVMIDYCGAYAEKAQPLFDAINAQPDASSPEAIKAAGDMDNLYNEYPYLETFRNAIYNTEESALGADNVKRLRDYEKYEAFPLPDGAGPALQQPGVEGQIEQMPDTDTSGVISEGVGEEVAVEVK